MNKIGIICVAGTDRSGSTLLDKIIGSNKKILNTGEIHRIYEYFENDLSCECGSTIPSCSFWNSITYDIPIEKIYVLGWKRRIGIMVLRFLKLGNLAKKFYYHEIMTYYFLYYRLLAKTNSKFVVDSCKDMARVYLLAQSGYFNIKVIYLTRKLEDYIVSMQKTQPGRKNERRIGTIRIILKWWFRNSETRHYLKALNLPFILVSYYELAKNPFNTFKRISEFIGTPITYDADKIKNTSFHSIGGNNMKFKKFNGVNNDCKNCIPLVHSKLLKTTIRFLTRKYTKGFKILNNKL